VGSYVYRKNHCDLQPWAWSMCTLPAVHKSTLPSTLHRMMAWYSLFVLKVPLNTKQTNLRGTVNEYQLSGWVIIINGDGGRRR